MLIVDDSALMRRQLSALFEAEGDFAIRLARNGQEAVEENIAFQPNVVTLDINMPVMDGLTALASMMAERPVPVVMLSSLTEKGALATFEALNLGAVDFVAKPGGTISLSLDNVSEMLVAKVRAAVRARIGKPIVRTRLAGKPAKSALPKDSANVRQAPSDEGIVVIGVSTGGPRTLEHILPQLPEDFPWPIVVVQHMPASFTLPFANRMNELCALKVVEASRPMALEPGTAYIGKGGADVQVVKRAGKATILPKPESAEYLWHPSVEMLARSVLDHYEPKNILAVMLTGMGYDGADAFADIKKRGGRTIAESRESAVIFGMPAELISRGGATVTLHCEKIAKQISVWVCN